VRNGQDYQRRDCDLVREMLSARLDGAPEPVLPVRLADHLAECTDCRNWQEAAHLLTRRVRLTLAKSVPDQTGRILDAVLADRAAVRPPGRVSPRWARVGLVAAALAQLLIIVPALLGNAGIGVPPHASRELGAFNLALAVGFAAAALRPGRARGMLPLVGAAIMGLVLLAAVDTVTGDTTVLAETPHLIAVAGWFLLYALARRDEFESGGPHSSNSSPESDDRTGLPRRWLTWLPARLIRPAVAAPSVAVAERSKRKTAA
jgi:predicted anti-sigma-YlaC factor YlaD